MNTVSLHPEFLVSDGVKHFAVLPYREYLELREFLEDVQDLLDLRQAREEAADELKISLEDVKKDLGLI